MQINPILTQCQDCISLKTLLERIDCSLYNLSRNRLNNEYYNTERCYSVEQSNHLSHLKRIVTKRIFNANYPSECTSAQDIIAAVSTQLYGDWTCSKCVNCDPMDNTSPDPDTDTSSSSTTSTTII